MRSALAAILEMAGFACAVYAAWLVALPLGLLALGVALVVVAAMLDSTGKPARKPARR